MILYILSVKKVPDLTAATILLQQATDSTLVCPVKMEYGPENDILVLELMMKSGLEKICLKFLHAQAVF